MGKKSLYIYIYIYIYILFLAVYYSLKEKSSGCITRAWGGVGLSLIKSTLHGRGRQRKENSCDLS
jgi:hypothetical protein